MGTCVDPGPNLAPCACGVSLLSAGGYNIYRTCGSCHWLQLALVVFFHPSTDTDTPVTLKQCNLHCVVVVCGDGTCNCTCTAVYSKEQVYQLCYCDSTTMG